MAKATKTCKVAKLVQELDEKPDAQAMQALAKLMKAGLVGRSRLVYISPAMASAWLNNNRINRKLDMNHVKKYVKILMGKKWIPASGTILRDKYGALLNGQHRLHAVVATGLGIWAYVCDELATEVYYAVDTDQKNRPLEALLPRELSHKKETAGMVNAIRWLDDPDLGDRPDKGLSYELLALYEKYHVSIAEIVKIMRRPQNRKFPASALAAFAYVHAAQHQVQQVKELAQELTTGIGRTATSMSGPLESVVASPKGTGKERIEMMLKTLRGIQLHLDGEFTARVLATPKGLQWARELHKVFEEELAKKAA